MSKFRISQSATLIFTGIVTFILVTNNGVMVKKTINTRGMLFTQASSTDFGRERIDIATYGEEESQQTPKEHQKVKKIS